MQKCSFISFSTVWEEVLIKGPSVWRGKILKGVVCKLAWGSIVYNIWRHRNNVKFGNRLCTKEQILQNICWEVRTRIVVQGKRKFKAFEDNEKLCITGEFPPVFWSRGFSLLSDSWQGFCLSLAGLVMLRAWLFA
jgi:hypothetical protein